MFENVGLYKKLLVWQKSMQFVRCVYELVKKFPKNEQYALSDQLRRAVVSIPSNIAEGSGRSGNRDYGHFLSISRGSLYEVMTQIEIANDLGYVNSDLTAIETLAEEISKMLTSMIKKYIPLSN